MQRRLHDSLLFDFVHLYKPRSRRRGRRTACIQHLAPFARELLQAMADLVPRPLILRLFLTPDDLARVRVATQDLRVFLPGESIKLLDTNERYIAPALLAARLQEIEIDLAGAEDDPAHRLNRDIVNLADHRGKPAARELLQRGDLQLVPEKTLRRHQDERLSEVAQHLPPEHMKHLGWR